MAEFVRRAAVLGDKLGALLFQLPPSRKKDLHWLRDFLAVLPSDGRVALEFRNASWQDEAVYEALRDRGVALCVTVTDTDDGETPFVATAGCGYLRLRRTHYDDADLRAWVERIAARGLPRTYVYFRHEDEEPGAGFARRLTELWRAAGGSA